MKSQYRETILRMMDYVKVTKFCEPLGLSQSNLSWFLKGRDERMSEENLKMLIDCIRSTLVDL